MNEVDDWLDKVLAINTVHMAELPGGRIINSLRLDDDPDRTELSHLLLAAIMQERYPAALELLQTRAGVTPDPTPTATAPKLDESRPTFIRPNGKKYYARKWGDKQWDVDILREARAIGSFPLLLGKPGTGKTALVEGAFGDELVTVVMTGDTMVSGLVGGFTPDGKGDYRWARGPLQIAVEEGRPLFIDEILLGNPSVLSVLYPLMDGRGFLEIQENPELGTIHAKEGFFIVGASNPDVPGAKMSEALADRFDIQVEVTTDWDLARALGFDERIVTVLESLAIEANNPNATFSWSPQFREVEAFNKLEKKFGRAWAVHNMMRKVPKFDREEIQVKLAPLLGGPKAVIPAKI